ncbi:hypothetical protein M0804_002627 [Polistes exclamans]|nr:hypothetical protein M0804_002627 [Polistes exclamans]
MNTNDFGTTWINRDFTVDTSLALDLNRQQEQLQFREAQPMIRLRVIFVQIFVFHPIKHVTNTKQLLRYNMWCADIRATSVTTITTTTTTASSDGGGGGGGGGGVAFLIYATTS